MALGPPSSYAAASSSSFRSFALSLADARHLSFAGRLSSDAQDDGIQSSGSVPTALRFAQVCLEQAERQQGAEVGEAAIMSSQADPSSSASGWDENGAPGEESRQRWILEARTWELVHALCADRYLFHPEAEDEESRRDVAGSDGPGGEGSSSSWYQTPFERVQDVLDAKRGLRELKVSIKPQK